MRLKTRLRRWLRETAGIDVRRWPHPETLIGHVARLLAAARVDCALDVGANVGDYARSLRAAGFAGDIVSFEPAPEPFAELARRAAADPRWYAVPSAIGAESGEAALHLSGSSTIASFREMAGWYRAEHPRGEAAGDLPVPVRRLDRGLLDEVLGRRPSRLFLKSDTQGYEEEVLRGAEAILADVLVLQVELSVRPVYVGVPAWRPMIDAIEGRGFELATLFPVAYDRRLRVVELDGVFLRPEIAGDSG